MNKFLKNALLVAFAAFAIALVSCTEDEEKVPDVVASFTSQIENGTVTFTNTSENAGTYSWDFGDDSTPSTLQNPVYTYEESGEYTVSLTASRTSDDETDTFSETISVTVLDGDAPVISLVGDEALCLNIGDTYTDPGATAADEEDGDLTASITVGGDQVVTSMEGTYEVTYNVSDAAGNAATEVVRTVVVSAVFNVIDNLVVNGDFNAPEGWTGAQTPEIRKEGCSTFFFANVAAAGNSSDVNLQQVLEIEVGATYTLTFDANSDGARTIIAGIGKNAQPFTSTTETVNLTATSQTFVLEGLVAGFGGANSRVFFDLGAATGVVVIDNVSLVLTEEASDGSAPTVAAPTPNRPAADVISIYSDAYTDVMVDTWRTSWSDAVYEEVMIAGNAVQKYSLLDFVGVETTTTNVDATEMTHIHVDVWSENFTQFGLKLVNFSTPAVEHQVDKLSPTQGEWVSYDIPLSDFTGLTARANIAQFIFVGRPIKLNTIFLDNIYFYKGETTGGGGGGGGTGNNLAVNGDFETGTTSGWTVFDAQGGTFAVVDTNPKTGTWAGKLSNGEAQEIVIKQANLSAGTIQAGASVTISFDMRGALQGDGGVIFAELFSEITPEGVSKSEILGGGAPISPTADWKAYTYTTTLGSNVSGGVTLQLKTACGAVSGCAVEAYFDNVTITVN